MNILQFILDTIHHLLKMENFNVTEISGGKIEGELRA
jgi:hypothetical protein